MPEQLTSAQVATRLGVTRTTVINYVDGGKLKPIAKLPGPNGAYLFTEKAVIALEKLLERRAP